MSWDTNFKSIPEHSFETMKDIQELSENFEKYLTTTDLDTKEQILLIANKFFNEENKQELSGVDELSQEEIEILHQFLYTNKKKYSKNSKEYLLLDGIQNKIEDVYGLSPKEYIKSPLISKVSWEIAESLKNLL